MNSKETTGGNGSTIKELGTVILSLEEEINDRNIKALENEVDRLNTLWQKDGNLGAFVKIIGATGRYIGSKRADAHADALPTIKSAFTSLEKVINSREMPPDQKRALAAGELEKFNALKKKIAGRAGKPPEKPAAAPAVPGDLSTIADLKAVILSLDWEISDNTIFNLEKEIGRLKSLWAGNKVHLAFLQIIHVVGKYVGSRRADAHADSITLLHSVFNSLESIVKNPGIPVRDQQEILETELRKFNDLKKQIAEAGPSPTEKEADKEGARKAPTGAEQDSEPRGIPPAYPLQTGDGTDAHGEEEMGAGETVPPALSHVEAPAGTGFDTLRAYEVEPLTEVNTRLDAFFDEVPEPAPPGPSPMDDLFGSHKVSPADELLQEIHLQVLGEEDGFPGRKGASPASAKERAGASPDVREFIPSRKEGEPFQEIDDRLDEFFDEDAPLSDSAFSDNGEEVVPYRLEDETGPAAPGDFETGVTPALSEDVTGEIAPALGETDQFPMVQPLEQEETGAVLQIPAVSETVVPESGALTPESETFAPESVDLTPESEAVAPESGKLTPESKAVAPESEGITPFQFEDEFFEEETEPEVVDDQPVSNQEELILKELRAGIRKIGKNVDKLTTEGIYKEISALEKRWDHEPDRLIYLKILNSLILYIGMMGTESKREALELLHRVHETLEQAVWEQAEIGGRGQLPLLDAISGYIDLQDKIVQDLSFTKSRYKGSGTKIPTGEETEPLLPLENGEQPRKPGLWSRIMSLFGAGKS